MVDKKKQTFNRRQPAKITAFFAAVRAGETKRVRMILKRREIPDIDDVDRTVKSAPTALIIACKNSDKHMVQVLLKAKPKTPDVNLPDGNGRRPVWFAVECGDEEILQLLLKTNNVDVNFLDPKSGMTPLFRSIMKNSTEVCRLLIHARSDVNLRQLGFNSEAESPLMKSVQLGNLEICGLLVNSLCHIEARTESGYSALHYSVAYRRYDICEFLLEHKINIHGRSKHGVTSLTLAISHNLPLMVRILIEFGYRIERPYQWEETPLQQAIAVHSEECAMTLVHWGCSLNKPSSHVSYYWLAMSEGLFVLGRLISEIQPSVLNESWVRDRHFTLSLCKKPDYCDWLMRRSSSPMTLQYLCRARIWRALGRYAPRKAQRLGLPRRLIEFVCYSEYFCDEDIYREKSIDITECPYDCLSACNISNCPPLDFLPSDEYE